MRLRKMLVTIAAIACIGVGLIQASSAYASSTATPSVTSINQTNVPGIPNIGRSLAVNVTVYCGQFTGTLHYYIFPIGRAFEYQFSVNGTLYARCGGTTAHLRAYWTPKLQSEQTALIGNTTGSQRINWGSNVYTVPIGNMHVLLCTFSSHGGGCASSPNV